MAFGTDERRRLIYELLIEAKGIQEQRKKLEAELLSINKAVGVTKTVLKDLFGGLAVAGSVIELGNMISNVQKLNEQLAVIGITGKNASQALKDIQDTAFTTGQSIDAVAGVYEQAAQVVQQLGGTQADAAKLTEAFTRAMVAQGKTAGDAAAQLDVLQFALGRGSLNMKEFQALLKENNVLQTAAQEALHATTGQLLEMAERGDIGADAIKKILDRFEELAAQQEVGITLDRIIEQVKTVGSTFVAAASDALGFSEVLKKGFAKETEETVLSVVRRIAQGLFGMARAMSNVAQIVFDTMTLVTNIFSEAGREHVFEEWTRDIGEMNKGLRDVNRAFGFTVPDESVFGDKTVENAARLAASTKEIAHHLDDATATAIGNRVIADIIAGIAKEYDSADRRIQQSISETRKRIDDYFKHTFDLSRQVKDALKTNADQIEEDEKRAAEAQEKRIKENQELWDNWIAEREKKQQEATDRAREFNDVVSGELENVFTRQTQNARTFFASIAQGFAQILASQAAQQLVKLLAGLFGNLSVIPGTPIRGVDIGGGPSVPWSPAAHGAAFANGHMLKLAQGGVVTQPTAFAMAGGMGLMGEAGAEAVMPLKRMSNGNLGVASSMPAITIVNQTGVSARGRISRASDHMQIVLEAAQLGAQLAEDRMNRSIRSGYGATAASLQRTYALRRGGGV